MSYNSLADQVIDTALMRRVDAAAHQEAIENPIASGSGFGHAIRNNQTSAIGVLGWPVCVATEAPYEYALDSGNPNPGGDPAVSAGEFVRAMCRPLRRSSVARLRQTV
jgi:hypothetical protein